MSYTTTLVEPNNKEALDLKSISDQITEENPNDINAGYGRCNVPGCNCSSFVPITTIPGGMGTCDKCNHGIYDHS